LGSAAVAAAILVPAASADDKVERVVVTGSVIRNTKTVSPITVINAQEMERRGTVTVQDAIQGLSNNAGPALPNSFTANGAFAGGASGASLRGLTVNSTLVLFDGMRASYYPLADDGTRNFVDLNTIPDDIVDRVEVLRDGASSLYGADAIAGVINIITKREFQGMSARGEAGLSSRGDAMQDRESITLGTGDLDDDGYNFYVSGFRYNSDALANRDRPYPFNTDDLRGVCYQGNCGPTNIVNDVTANGTPFPVFTAADFLLRPATIVGPLPNQTAFVAGSRWQHAGPCTGNSTLTPLSAAQLAGGTAPLDGVCPYDFTKLYGMITPDIERWGLSGRATALLKNLNSAEAYLQFNFMESSVSYSGFPASVVANANTGIFFPRFTTNGLPGGANAVGSYPLFLPVYVCPAAQQPCAAIPANLNPQNPFAALGQVARVIGRNHDEVTQNSTRNRSYRVAAGISGEFDNGWAYDVSATAMHTDLLRETDGYIYIQHLLDVVADGTYNFANPSATPQSVKDYLTPKNSTPASSDQVQLQAVVSAPLLELDGGTMVGAIGGTIRYEAVDAPSANSDINGPTERYFTLNAFGTQGARRIYGAFAEVNAPIFDNLDVSLSGRYDNYSSGQSAFSPKVGARFEVFDELALRATYSEGFRIASFAEANGLPTTGFVTNNVSLFNDVYLAQYLCTTATFNTCPTYIRSGSYGQTTLATPGLDPEESTNFTAGAVLQPFKWFDLAIDYYVIEKTGVITQPSNAPAIQAYYNGLPIPAGYTVIPDAPDPNFPLATPRIAFVQSNLINADTYRVEGWDGQANLRTAIDDYLSVNSTVDVSYIAKLTTEFPNGTVERYDGTLGNFNLTSGNGTSKWRGVWRTTLSFGSDFDLTSTVNWYAGYDLSAMDQGTGYKDCGLSSGITPCRVDDYFTVDLNGQAHLTDNATLYLNVMNVADEMPPVDPVTYGAHMYNAVQGGNGILGRYFRAGVKFNY
jgi:iron complex outermembrane receptor protein